MSSRIRQLLQKTPPHFGKLRSDGAGDRRFRTFWLDPVPVRPVQWKEYWRLFQEPMTEEITGEKAFNDMADSAGSGLHRGNTLRLDGRRDDV